MPGPDDGKRGDPATAAALRDIAEERYAFGVMRRSSAPGRFHASSHADSHATMIIPTGPSATPFREGTHEPAASFVARGDLSFCPDGRSKMRADQVERRQSGPMISVSGKGSCSSATLR